MIIKDQDDAQIKSPIKESLHSLKITFIEKTGAVKEVDAPVGLSILEIARMNDVDLDGACGGSLACSTCHVVVEPEWFNKLEDPIEEEEDLLDITFGTKKTSRLGCQIIMTEELDGMIIRIPDSIGDL